MIERTKFRLLAAMFAVTACSPTLNWREVRPEGSGAEALFPCKPESRTRSLTLAGGPATMTLLACSAGDATFGLAFADVVDPARVAAALAELARAAAGNLDAAAPAASAPLSVPGMTPNPAAARLGFAGKRPDGAAVAVHAALFVKGTRVFQATVVGPVADDGAIDTFFGALRLPA